MKITMMTAGHKPYEMPKDPLYLPVQAGAAGKESIGFVRDDTGDNISEKNPSFCELTALYWGWKNLDADYLGLDHYRRHFQGRQKGSTPMERVLTLKEVKERLQSTDVILPKKRHYYIETLRSHYEHTHYGKDLEETRKVIAQMYPRYLPAFDQVMKRTYGHMFNMMMMRRPLLDSYCTFLFDVLFELEKRLDITDYDAFQARLYGRISELLLDVWVETNQISYQEVPVISMEPVPWLKKGTSFLKAKFLGKKYKGSF